MSQDNVDALRRVYEAMARGDFWAAREVFDRRLSGNGPRARRV
jgi:hypothetical protein